MNKTVTDLIGTKNYDPTTLDTTEIQSLSKSLPKDGNIDTNNAEVLATKFLRGSDLCGEIMSIATAFVSRTKDAKQKAYNQAFLIKSQDQKGIKTDKMRVAFAELDEDYQNACEMYNKAISFHKWIDSKHSSFIRAHYLCKKIMERGYEGENAAGWKGGVGDEEDDGW